MRALRIFLAVGLPFFCAMCASVEAAQTAWIKANWAIVYADKQLLSPVGKIRQGRKVRVGEVARGYGSILPIALNDRIAYVQVKDLTFERGGEGEDTTEHQFSRQFDLYYEASDTFTDDMKENNHVLLTYAQMQPGGDWKLLSDAVGDSVSSASVFKLGFEHRPPYYRLSWGAHIGLYTISQSSLKFIMPTLDFGLNLALLKNNWLNLELSGKVMFSADAEMQLAGNGEKKNGSMWGLGAGGETVIFPYRTLSFKGHCHVQSLYFLDMPTFAGIDVPLDSMTGVEVGASLSYLF